MLGFESEFDPREAKLFTQNGPYGCVTACLANVGHLLLGEEITPSDVDAELGRDITEDLLAYDRTTWLLRRGLKIHSLIDPDSLILEAYLDGTNSYEEMIVKFAHRYYEGDIQAATEDFGSEDYREFVQRTKDRKPSFEAELEHYVQSGQYTEELRPVVKRDLNTALRAGKAALLITSGIDGSVGHQLLLYSPVVGKEIDPTIYDPDPTTPLITGIRSVGAALKNGLFDTGETFIISN